MSGPSFDFQPVIIVGAARSGTNMLRDMLTQIAGIGTWPCDEINYIWRHHNARLPHDEFEPRHATPSATRYIRGAFQKMATKSQSKILIEKTCANSLRVGFVDAVIPEAKYICLIRDGRDVVLSALKRWKAPLEPRYLMKKVPFVPWTDLPYYASRYIANRIHRLLSKDRQLSSWGPRFTGINEMLANCPLDEVCAEQWRRSVESSVAALEELPGNRVHLLRYEDMVASPGESLSGVLQFLGVELPANEQQNLTSGIFANSVGGWKSSMSTSQRQRLEAIMGHTLREFHYETLNPARNWKAA
ncbi:MAG: sulfotransferase [Planctomycetaceae bacterium]